MILNHPELMLRESRNHYNTKLLIGELADKELTRLAQNRNFNLYVAYEFQFDALWVEKDTKKPRLYTGDVTILLFHQEGIRERPIDREDTWKMLQDGADIIMNIEVDGYMGHDSLIKRSNNTLRDDELKRQFGIFVHRIQVQTGRQRTSWQSETLQQIIKFYYDCIFEWSSKNSPKQLQ